MGIFVRTRSLGTTRLTGLKEGETLSYDLLDLSGRIIQSARIEHSNQFELESGDLAQGKYLIRVTSPDAVIVTTVIVN